jgi:hypothetical protein
MWFDWIEAIRGCVCPGCYVLEYVLDAMPNSSQPQFLWIATPPYSGSTALVRILNTSPYAMLLQRNGEGQWLVPSLCEGDRWDLEKPIDWDAVKQTWGKTIEQVNQLVGTIQVVLEKSPPNLVRLEALMQQFPNSVSFGFVRDPYANCASTLYRHHQPDQLAGNDRRRTLTALANQWIFRAEQLRDRITTLSLLHFTYEQFCADPGRYIAQVQGICPALRDVDVTATVDIKDYQPQPIIDQNPRQIARLLPQDLEIIAEVLVARTDLLNFFGYSAQPPV